MVNFGPPAAKIGSGVWGTTADFNRFHVFAPLLPGTLVVASAQCSVEHRAPPIFGRAAITLGFGPHSSYYYFYVVYDGTKTVDNTIEKNSFP